MKIGIYQNPYHNSLFINTPTVYNLKTLFCPSEFMAETHFLLHIQYTYFLGVTAHFGRSMTHDHKKAL